MRPEAVCANRKWYAACPSTPRRLTTQPTTIHQRDDLDRRLLVQYAISRALAESETVDEALSFVLAELVRELGWRLGAFWLADGDRQRLRCSAVWSSAPYPEFRRATLDIAFRRGEGVPGRVWESATPFWHRDVTDADHFPRQEIARREGLHGVFAFPIFIFEARGDAPVAPAMRRSPIVPGVIELYSEHVEPPDEQMLQVAQSIGFQLGAFLESRRAFDAERAARIRNAAVVDIALDCIITIDHEGRILEWNPAAERTFGHTRAAVLGRQMADTIVPPHYREAHYRGVAKYLQTGDSRILGHRVEVEGMRADGSLFPCELAITRVPIAGPPVFTAYLRDLTERHRLESRQHLLLNATKVIFSSLDYEQTLCNLSRVVVPAFADWYAVDVLESDRTLRRLETTHRDPAKVELAKILATRYGRKKQSSYGPAAAIRTRTSQLVPEVNDDILADLASDDEHLRLLRRVGLRSFIIVPLLGRHEMLGSISFVSAESGRRYDASDLQVAEELATRAAEAIENARLFADVDETRQLLEQQATELEAQSAELETTASELEHSNAELRTANDELAARTREAERARAEAEAARHEADEANRAKSEFLAAMSHELRTPLNAIIGYAQLLDVGVHGPVSEDQHADLGRIERSSQHLLGLINDILNYAKVESGRVQYDIEPTPLDQALASVEELTAPLAAAKHITYHIHSECPGARICADKEKLRQILVNVLSNAIRYTPEHGLINVSCAGAGSDVLIHVTDTGVGIPPDKLEAVFEPFVQVDRAYPGQREGTGLGLSISRELARGMEGDLTVHSELGKGSVFTLRLRRA
jgi:PAS domain S-box-containing protein